LREAKARVALVTGASRGIGRAVAAALDGSGFTVYATGRSIATADLPRSGRALPCGHTDDGQVEAVFEQLLAESDTIDVLVNAVGGGYERMVVDGEFTWAHPFWLQPSWRWDSMMTAGVRAGLVATQHAAKSMVEAKSGLIVHLSHWAAQKHRGSTIYGISKAATDKMAADMATELKDHGVVVISLYPGLVRTELTLASGAFDFSNSESPEFIDRTVAAIARDPGATRHSGKVLVAAQLARSYGFVDIDGKSPTPLTLDDM